MIDRAVPLRLENVVQLLTRAIGIVQAKEVVTSWRKPGTEADNQLADVEMWKATRKLCRHEEERRCVKAIFASQSLVLMVIYDTVEELRIRLIVEHFVKVVHPSPRARNWLTFFRDSQSELFRIAFTDFGVTLQPVDYERFYSINLGSNNARKVNEGRKAG